ncbi:MAG: phage tail protein, partial [Alphaproteobacteria bacterium]
MPFVIGAIVTAAGLTGVAATIASVVLSLAASVVLSAVGGLLAKKPKRGDLAELVGGRTEMITAPIQPRRTIYGTVMVSGPIVYAQTYGKEEGIPNAYLSLVIALAGHQVEAITQVWFGDRKIAFLADGVTAGDPYSTRAKADPGGDIILDANGTDFAHVWKHLGATTQLADSTLIAKSGGKWTNQHRLRGIAYVHARLRWDDRVFASGIPDVRCVVQGKKLYDTRTSTTAFSHNPALAVHDYLTNVLGIAAADIDTASVNAAANVCDEAVTLKSGGTEDRYRVNGTVDANERPIDVLAGLLGAMAGTLVITGGKFTLHAGSPTAATVALTEADIIAPVTVLPRMSRRDLFNAVKPVYVDPDRDWQPVDAPLITNAAYEAQDGGARIAQTIEFAFTSSRARAQRLGKIQLERARQQITAELDVRLKGLQLAAWSTCTLTIARFGWSAKKFRVVGWRLNEDGSVHLTLREESDAMWSWAS